MEESVEMNSVTTTDKNILISLGWKYYNNLAFPLH